MAAERSASLRAQPGPTHTLHTHNPQGITRTSNLSAPIIQLSGHGGEVFSMRFSPDGQCIASGSFDKSIFLWRTYDETENYNVITVGVAAATGRGCSAIGKTEAGGAERLQLRRSDWLGTGGSIG